MDSLLTRPIHSLAAQHWHWATVTLGLLVITAGAATWAHVPLHQPILIPALFAVVFASLHPTWLLAFIVIWPRWWGWTLRAVAFLVLNCLLFWHAASILSFADQGRPLLWDEVRDALANNLGRSFILSLLLSWKACLLSITIPVAATVLWRLTRDWESRTHALVSLSLIITMVLGSRVTEKDLGVFDEDGGFLLYHLDPACAPWSAIHLKAHQLFSGNMHKNQETEHSDLEAARALLHQPSPWSWSEPGHPLLSSLAGKYVGRDVLVILLESHRLSFIAPHGEGSWKYRSLSPRLSTLMNRGVFFSNYFQPGQASIWAIFSTITGLTPPVMLTATTGAADGNRLAQVTPFQRFRDLGYATDFLVGCPYSFWHLSDIVEYAGMTGPLSREESASLDRTRWNCWGLDDEQLYQVAWQRMTTHRQADKPRIQVVKTSSNHNPYRFYEAIPGVTLTDDHDGGMRYADFQLGRFMEKVLALPETSRPVIFITADHSHTDDLKDKPPLFFRNLEALRIPGLLILPDGRAAGQICDTLLSHQDLVDLLLLLTDPQPSPGPRKFIDRQRTALPIALGGGYGIITPTHYLSLQVHLPYRIVDRWNVVLEQDETIKQHLRALLDQAWMEHDRIWRRVPTSGHDTAP